MLSVEEPERSIDSLPAWVSGRKRRAVDSFMAWIDDVSNSNSLRWIG